MSKIAPDHASSKIWFPEIDGMRAVAAILVVLHHYQGQVFGTYSAANLSVSAFFVISGFLIYYLAEVESRKTGKMRLGKYFFSSNSSNLPDVFLYSFSIARLIWQAGDR